MIASSHVSTASQGEYETVLDLIKIGKLFELMDWVENSKPTLCPDFEKPKYKQSPFLTAIELGNHSMVRYLWEKCWQREWEISDAVDFALGGRNKASYSIAKYLIDQDLPTDNVSAYSAFISHDDSLIYSLLDRGMSVRGPDGFADALIGTGCSKPMLRLYRELSLTNPDIVTEGLIALREAVQKDKIRATALLTWAGIDPRTRISDDPYEPGDADETCEYTYISAYGHLVLNKQTREMLKAMKVDVTVEVWLYFLKQACWLHHELAPEVFHWIKKPEATLLAHLDKATEMGALTLRHLGGWRASDWVESARQSKKFEILEYFLSIGIPLLKAEDSCDHQSIRRSLRSVVDSRRTVRLIWLIYVTGDDAQRDFLKEIVRTPAMQKLVREFDPFLLAEMKLGSKHLQKQSPSKRDRPWHLETFKSPTPFAPKTETAAPPILHSAPRSSSSQNSRSYQYLKYGEYRHFHR